jgi:hypothetical protein
LLEGPVEFVSDDYLMNFIEVETKVDCEVKNIHHGDKKGVVMVEFQDPVGLYPLFS